MPEYRSGLQIALFVGIAGLYFWPWLADRFGRRTLLAVNIALFSLLMPVVALSPTFALFIVARSLVGFALNGEWSLGSMLVAETWPARLRGRVISFDALDLVSGRLARRRHYRTRRRQFRLARRRHGARRDRAARDLRPRHLSGIALLGARAGPQAAHRRDAGARRPRQRRRPRVVRKGQIGRHPPGVSAGRAARHIGGVVRGLLQHLHFRHSRRLDAAYLATEKHWSTAEYSTFYVFWGIFGFLGLCVAGWLADKIGRRLAFVVMLIEGAIFMTLWVYTENHVLLWVFGLAWSFGFLGFWGPSTTLTAEVFPTRIRGAANGVVWAIAYFVGFVLFPFVTVALQQHTGSFALSFLCIPVLMVAMAIGVMHAGARAFRQGAKRDHRVRRRRRWP